MPLCIGHHGGQGWHQIGQNHGPAASQMRAVLRHMSGTIGRIPHVRAFGAIHHPVRHAMATVKTMCLRRSGQSQHSKKGRE